MVAMFFIRLASLVHQFVYTHQTPRAPHRTGCARKIRVLWVFVRTSVLGTPIAPACFLLHSRPQLRERRREHEFGAQMLHVRTRVPLSSAPRSGSALKAVRPHLGPKRGSHARVRRVAAGEGQMGSALMGSIQILCFLTEGLFGYSR